MLQPSSIWIQEVQSKLDRKNKILFEKQGAFLTELDQLILQCSHKTLILWSLKLAKTLSIELTEKFPEITTFEDCHTYATLWSEGKIKMAQAKKEILNCHSLAKTMVDKEAVALTHALAQGCSVVHTPKHAIGLPIYQLSALVFAYGLQGAQDKVLAQRQSYLDLLHYFNEQSPAASRSWAPFIKE